VGVTGGVEARNALVEVPAEQTDDADYVGAGFADRTDR
jgi:hypothetical protein